MANIIGTIASASQLLEYTYSIASSVVTAYQSDRDAPQKYKHYQCHVQQLAEIANHIQYLAPTNEPLCDTVHETMLEAQALDAELQRALVIAQHRPIRRIREAITDSQARAISRGLETLRSRVEELKLALIYADLVQTQEIQKSVEDLRQGSLAPFTAPGNHYEAMVITGGASVSNGDFVNVNDESGSDGAVSNSIYPLIKSDSSTVHNGNTVVGRYSTSCNTFKRIEINGGRARNGNFVGSTAREDEKDFLYAPR